MLQNKTITFLGAGSMAEAMIAGLIQDQIVAPKQIIATNRNNHDRLDELRKTYQIKTATDRNEAVALADVIILAMKPHGIDEAINDIHSSTKDEQLFVSVLAGTPTAHIEKLLGREAYVIRTMPNTSAKVGESATAISKGAHATAEHIAVVEALFSAIGTVTVVEENKLDAVTGLAGSGPAYFYYLIEAMERASIEAGLSSEEARALVTQTVVGVGKRLQTTTKSTEQLYTEVMSPQGTTEAGINILREHHAQQIVHEAVTKAISRSKELGSIYNK